MPHFGSKVTGESAHAKAVAAEKGGAGVFGVRVRGAIPENGPTNTAKRNTEHGPRVTEGATFQNPQGEVTDAVSVEELKRILDENGTTFDSLFEAELARDAGARPAALEVFLTHELTGLQRPDVIDDIRQLLGRKANPSAASARAADLQLAAYRAQSARVQQNTEEAATGRHPATMQGQADAIGDGESAPEPKGEGEKGEEPKFETMTKDELTAYLGDDAASVKGTGSGGDVVKADLVRAARKKHRKAE